MNNIESTLSYIFLKNVRSFNEILILEISQIFKNFVKKIIILKLNFFFISIEWKNFKN